MDFRPSIFYRVNYFYWIGQKKTQAITYRQRKIKCSAKLNLVDRTLFANFIEAKMMQHLKQAFLIRNAP